MGFSILLVLINRIVITAASYIATEGRNLSGLLTMEGFKKAAFSNFARLMRDGMKK
jgi:hypothetical protein